MSAKSAVQYLQQEGALTVRQLKDIIKNWPETDEYGEPAEVWLGNSEGVSNPAIEIWPLNYRKNDEQEWADLYLVSKE